MNPGCRGSSYYSTLGDVLDPVYRPVIVPVTRLAPRPSPLSLLKTPLAPRPSPPLIQNCLIAIFVHETGEFAKNRKINVTISLAKYSPSLFYLEFRTIH